MVLLKRAEVRACAPVEDWSSTMGTTIRIKIIILLITFPRHFSNLPSVDKIKFWNIISSEKS